MDVRIYAVEYGKTGKILYAQHKGRPAFIGHHHHVWLKTSNAHQIMPAKNSRMLKIVPGHCIPAAGRKGVAEKRTAYPQ